MAEDFNRIPALLQALHAGAVVGIRKATKGVHDGYVGYVAVDTGFTRAAGYYVTSDNSTYSQAVGKAQSIDPFRAILPEVDHPEDDLTGIAADAAASAIYLEMGTSKMAAQPAMHPAAEAMRGKLPGIMASEMGKAIKKIVK